MLFIDDLKVNSGDHSRSFLYTLFFNPNFRAIRNYRISHYLYKKHFHLLPRLISNRNRVKYSIDIDYRAEIGGGLKIIHGIGIVVGMNVKAGKNLTLYQNVTLGGNLGKSKYHNGTLIDQPYIGDNVTIFAGATIIGPVVLGDNVMVGAKVTLLKDIDKDCVIIQKTNNITRFLNE